MNIYDPEKLQIIINDVWDNPDKYFDIDEETEDWYYDCLKFLWIGSCGKKSFNDLRLADLVTENIENKKKLDSKEKTK